MKHITTILLLILIQTANAQQLPIYNQYFTNPYLISPSCAGISNIVQANLHYRRQWIGITGAPESSLISLDGPVKNKSFGLGLIIANDKTNILGKTSVYTSYNYRVQLTDQQYLYMAISPGFVQNKVYFDKIRAEYTNEPTILENAETKTAFDVNAGITYRFKNFESTLSAFQLSQKNFEYENQFDMKNLSFRLIRHYYFTSKYTFKLKRNFELIPIANIRTVQGITPQYDLFALLKWNHTFWAAIGYRGNYGISFSIGGRLLDNLNMTYSFDMAMGNIALLSGGSHEIGIAYIITASNKQTLVEYKKQVETKPVVAAYNEEYELLQQENSQMQKQINDNQRELLVHKEEIERLNNLLEKNRANQDEMMRKFMVNIEEQLPFKESKDLYDEKQKQYHVIVGAYYKLEDAKFFQKILQRELSLETSVYEREDGKYFFVYTNRVANREELNKEAKRLKKLNITDYINGNIWIAE